MPDFLYTLLINLLAAIIVAIVMWTTKSLWVNGFNSEIVKTFRKPRGSESISKNCIKDQNKEMKKSTSVRILTLRGLTYVNDIPECFYNNLWDVSSDEKTKRTIEFITISEDSDAIIEKRAKAQNISTEEFKISLDLVFHQLKTKQKTLRNLKFLIHKEDIPFQLVILDDFLYVSFYLDDAMSRTIKYKRSNHGAYSAFVHYYEEIRKQSTVKDFNIPESE
jgi:hypothetical protein